MGLNDVQNSIVGDHRQRKCISGGQRRRASIALQLIAMLIALFLDEPTSGLDASSALSIMRLLASIARIGVTVICVLQQPRTEILNILDDLLLLGWKRQTYMEKAGDLRKRIQELGYELPDTVNPSDAVLDILSSRDQSAFSFNGTEGMNCPEPNFSSEKPASLAGMFNWVDSRKAPWYQQCLLHLVRGMRRQKTIYSIELLVGAVAGLMMGLVVYDFDGNLFHGIFRQAFDPLSSAVNYNLVPQMALVSSLTISKF